MEWNDDVLEEDNVLISKRNSESTDNASQDIKELCCTIELVVLMDQREEALVDGLTNHFTSWYKLGIQLMQNVLQVIPLNRLLGIKQFQELLHKLGSDVNLK